MVRDGFSARVPAADEPLLSGFLLMMAGSEVRNDDLGAALDPMRDSASRERSEE